MNEPPLTRLRRAVRPVLPGLAATAVLALLCNLALEVAGLADVESYPWSYKTPAFVGLFLLGSLVIWALVGLVHAVLGRLRLTVALVATATAVVAVADYEKLRLRQEPLYPSDWAFVGDLGFLTHVVGLRVVLLLVLGVLVTGLLAGAGAGAVLRRFHLHERPPGRMTRGRGLGVRALTGALCLVAVGYLGQFNSPGNAARDTYEALGASWRPWSQERNYLGNGFVGGFLYNLSVPTMVPPPGYDADRMSRVVEKYTGVAERINGSRDPDALDHVNVVMVLSESFSDPEALRGVHLTADPIPFTRRLAAAGLSGRMLTEHVGGGTANMEFEALTGMSMSQLPPQVAVPYQMLVPDYDTFPSAVDWFRRNGHPAVAIHPFSTEMYRRNEVYRTFGFDRFVSAETMRSRRALQDNPYVSDAAAFDEVRTRLESSDRPLFVHLVTMQNHIPYSGEYDDAPPVTGPDGRPIPDIAQYVRGLSYSDEALRDLVDALRSSDEKTVLVLYGDHLPADYPESVLEANSRRSMHETPFLVWSNFPGPRSRQPTTSPIHFMDLLLERAHAAVPPYYALLQQLRHQLPAMDGGMAVDASDRLVDRAHLSTRATALLRDYRLVQYDLSVGRRFSARAMFQVPPGT